jgi:predicted dithiol-disulfide oxidoreductase (DUF899 family)
MPRPARGRGRLAVVRSGPGASSATSSSRTSGYGSSRMGWERPWYTITDSFDADFGVDGWHGTSALLREGGQISRTYVIDSRGDEALGSTWSYLDMTALGRQEQWEASAS